MRFIFGLLTAWGTLCVVFSLVAYAFVRDPVIAQAGALYLVLTISFAVAFLISSKR